MLLAQIGNIPYGLHHRHSSVHPLAQRTDRGQMRVHHLLVPGSMSACQQEQLQDKYGVYLDSQRRVSVVAAVRAVQLLEQRNEALVPLCQRWNAPLDFSEKGHRSLQPKKKI